MWLLCSAANPVANLVGKYTLKGAFGLGLGKYATFAIYAVDDDGTRHRG
jgi:hypothetical protein